MSGTIKRKIGGVLCAALCMLCLAVPALAAPSYVPLSDYPHIEGALTKISDGVYEFKVYLAAFSSNENLNAKAHEAWKQVMGEWMSDDSYVVLSSFSSTVTDVGFQILAGPASSVSYTTVSGRRIFNLSSGHFFWFDLDGKLTRYVAVTANTASSVQRIYFNNYEFPSDTNYKILKDVRELRITDDLDGEPEPPSSSSAPEVPDVPYEPGKPPTGGGTSDNLPYDPSIWESFMWYMRDTIGDLGKVLILIAFLLSVVPLIISAIRHWAGSRDDHGGNLL